MTLFTSINQHVTIWKWHVRENIERLIKRPLIIIWLPSTLSAWIANHDCCIASFIRWSMNPRRPAHCSIYSVYLRFSIHCCALGCDVRTAAVYLVMMKAFLFLWPFDVPGTGKTYTLGRIIKGLNELKSDTNILICGATGLSSLVLKESLPHGSQTVTTVHNTFGLMDGRWGPKLCLTSIFI